MKRKFGFKNNNFNDKLQSIPNNFSSEIKGDVAEFTIYGEIGDSWFEDSTSANDVDNALKGIGDKDIVVRLNSPGGDAFDGVSIYNRLKQHNGKVTIHVDGYACSAASIIAMAGDEIIMGEGSMIMIHEASTGIWASKDELRATADMLEELENGLIDIYMTKAKVGRDEITDMVNAETWFSAKRAVEVGLATSVASPVEDKTEIENLKSTIINMQKELKELQNKSEIIETVIEEPEKVVATAKRRRLF